MQQNFCMKYLFEIDLDRRYIAAHPGSETKNREVGKRLSILSFYHISLSFYLYFVSIYIYLFMNCLSIYFFPCMLIYPSVSIYLFMIYLAICIYLFTDFSYYYYYYLSMIYPSIHDLSVIYLSVM